MAESIKIMLATDTHLGFLERDPVRGEDSFLAFQEVLELANANGVDLLLLGGDLFHDNRPSRKCMYRCMELLKQHCFGDRPVQIQLLSDPSQNFHIRSGLVNYEDPNVNIKLPVFSIHGNHDDPVGDGSLAALDLLSVSSLVNYFGKAEQLDDITVNPILLSKGGTKVAIYGIGYVRDERLHRLWNEKHVKFTQLAQNREDWFNILVLHQNRNQHTLTNWIPEKMLPDFFDFVLWGHEHECLIDPYETASGVHISQPGSSVATSLVEGEAKRKHVGILEIRKTEGDPPQFRLTKHLLKCVRPFMYEELSLADQPELQSCKSEEAVRAFLMTKIEDLIEQAVQDFPDQADHARLKLPLIRVKVEYTGYPSINPARLGQNFVGRVANPQDIVTYHRRRQATRVVGDGKHNIVLQPPQPLDVVRIDDLVAEYLQSATKSMEILPELDLTTAVTEFVDKDERDSIKRFVETTLKETQTFMQTEYKARVLNDEELVKAVAGRTEKRREEAAARAPAPKPAAPLPPPSADAEPSRTRRKDDDDDDFSADEMPDHADYDDDDPAVVREAATSSKRASASAARTSAAASDKPARGRGRGKAAPSSVRSARGKAPARGQTQLRFDKAPTPSAASSVRDDDEDDSMLGEFTEDGPKSRKRGAPASISSSRAAVSSRSVRGRGAADSDVSAVVIPSDDDEDSHTVASAIRDSHTVASGTQASGTSAVSRGTAWGRSRK